MSHSQANQTENVENARALAPDLARGVMLLLIAIANVSIYLWGHETNGVVMHPTEGSAIDTALSVLTILFVDGRIYPMFAFLFGYGMVQFATSRIERGLPESVVQRMLRRRHVWLIVFGAVHAVLLFAGDILGAYGLAGLILAALLFRRSDLALKITIGVLVGTFAFGALVLIGLGVLVSMLPPELTETTGADPFAMGSMADMMTGESNYLFAMLVRAGWWVVGTIGAALSFIVPACILLGWLAARHRWLEGAERNSRLPLVAAVGIAVGVAGAVPQALAYLGWLPFFAGNEWALTGIDQVAGIAGGIGYAALFGAVGARMSGSGSVVRRGVVGIGRRSLSFYLLQSVIFAPLLSAWGLGLGARIGTATAFSIAAGVWLVSLGLALWLEHLGNRGPAEVLLRRLTYAADDPGGNQQRLGAPSQQPTASVEG